MNYTVLQLPGDPPILGWLADAEIAAIQHLLRHDAIIVARSVSRSRCHRLCLEQERINRFCQNTYTNTT